MPGTEDRLSIVFYTGAESLGGAEVSLGILLGALSERIDAAIVGVNREVVDFVRAHRPAARHLVLPSVSGKTDVRGWLDHYRRLRDLRPRLFQSNVAGGTVGLHGLLVATLIPGVRTIVVERAGADVHNELQRLMRRFTNRRLAAHVSTTEFGAREVERLNGLPRGSVRVIPNAVPEFEPRPVPRVSDGYVIGTLSRLSWDKGPDVLVRAAALLPGTHLVIVGDGAERGRVETLARELGISERVHLTGWRSDARDYLSSFDVFVLPSRAEFFGLASVEAMRAGLPVIASRVGGIPEVVVEGENALLVEPDDPAALAAAIDALRRDPARARALGEHGRRHADRFSPQATARAYEQLYAEILDGGSARRPGGGALGATSRRDGDQSP